MSLRRFVSPQHFILWPCACCGEQTLEGVLCRDCAAHAHPHHDNDPYDDLGGGD